MNPDLPLLAIEKLRKAAFPLNSALVRSDSSSIPNLSYKLFKPSTASTIGSWSSRRLFLLR